MSQAPITAWGLKKSVPEAKIHPRTVLKEKHKMQAFQACSLFLLDQFDFWWSSLLNLSLYLSVKLSLLLAKLKSTSSQKKAKQTFLDVSFSIRLFYTFLYKCLRTSGYNSLDQGQHPEGYCKNAQSSISSILPLGCRCCGLSAQPDPGDGASRLCWWGLYCPSWCDFRIGQICETHTARGGSNRHPVVCAL